MGYPNTDFSQILLILLVKGKIIYIYIYIGHTGRIFEKDGRRFVEEISYKAFRGTELVYTQDWATSFPQKVFSFIEKDGITSMSINARAKEVTE